MQIYEALIEDHNKLKRLLTELISLNEDDHSGRDRLISEIRDELIPHARAEEAVFYNSLRSLDKEKDLVKHAYQEHMAVETTLRTLQAKDKMNLDWKKTAHKLRDSLEHHISEEENVIIPAARQLFTEAEAEQMCEAFEKLKPEVKEEGIFGNTMDMIKNLMPRRLTDVFGKNPDVGTKR